MQLGNFRQRITIQENRYQRDEANQKVADSVGAPIDDWVDVRTCWASMEPLSGREYFASAQVQAEQVTRFRIRYPRFQIWPGMRIKYHDAVLVADRYFDIQAVIDQNEMHVELWLMCVEQVKPMVAAGSGSSSSSAPVEGSEGNLLSGSGPPSESLGEDGDFYLDSTTGDLYQKTGGSWV